MYIYIYWLHTGAFSPLSGLSPHLNSTPLWSTSIFISILRFLCVCVHFYDLAERSCAEYKRWDIVLQILVLRQSGRERESEEAAGSQGMEGRSKLLPRQGNGSVRVLDAL
jgi:hypothetical protein